MTDLYFISVRKYTNALEFDNNSENYPSECGELIKSFTSKYKSMLEVEDYISDYIKRNQGDGEEFKYFSSIPANGDILSDDQQKKYGFFVLSNKKSISNFTIFKRERYLGIFINTYEDVKHFDISVQVLKNNKYLNKEYTCYDDFENYEFKENVLNEVSNTVKIAETQIYIDEESK